MKSDHPDNSQKLLSLKQAAKKLGVSVEILIDWNKHDILKPSITPDGEIGYTENQIDQFLLIQQKNLASETPASNEIKDEQPEAVVEEPTLLPSSPIARRKTGVYQKFVSWIGNGFYQDEYIKDYLKSQVKDSMTFTVPFPSKRVTSVAICIVALIGVG